MTRPTRLVIWTAITIVVLTATADAAATGEAMAPEVWELLKGLTWPSATVGALFSPPARAIAGWISARATPPQMSNARAQEISDSAQVLRDVVQHIKRSNEVQTKTVEILQQVERGLAILMDRDNRAGGVIRG